DHRTQGVALVVVQEEVTTLGRREVRKSSGYGAFSLDILMRVRHADLEPPEDLRGAQRCFPTANARLLDGQRKEDVGVSQHIVIEEIPGAGAEVVDVQVPIAKRNRHAKIML